VAAAALGASAYLLLSGVIGSEFLPHLDEGAIWVRGTFAPSTGPTEGARVMDQARELLASFPEVTQVISQVGRPDDGTDIAGFFNTEYFVDLKPKEQWRPVFRQNKETLIASMDAVLEKIPGGLWNFSQPIADNMEEAVSGVKGQLAIKIYGDDLKTLEAKGDQIVNVMRTIPGVADLGLFRVIGQPNLEFSVDRDQAARYGLNVADVQDAIETAVGGKAVSQILQGEQRYDVVVRYQTPYRNTKEAIENIRLVAPSGERVSLAQLCAIKVLDGASEIYREGNSRYVAIKYSVPVRDLGSTVEEAIDKVGKRVKLPEGYHIDWAGEYESQKRSQRRLLLVLPLTILVICMILYTMFKSFKWVVLILGNVAMAPIGGLLALWQRFFGRRFSRAVRRGGADRRDHAGVHQSIARAWAYRWGRCRGGIGAPVAAHHDDHAGGQRGFAAGGVVARNRLGFTTAVRHRNRGRTDRRAHPGRLSAADAVRLGRR
jgi:heavy metal efflux system protein